MEPFRQSVYESIIVPEIIQKGKESYQDLIKNNIENFIGLAKVPLGLAGPLLIHGTHANGEFYIPLATTEGTQVASTTRGMKIIHESGGVQATLIEDRGIQRAPVFEFESIYDAATFAREIQQDYTWLTPILESTTKFGKLKNIQPIVMGKFVHLRVTMTSGDAAGQNMSSVAVQKGAETLMQKYSTIRRFWMDAGISGEKTPSYINILNGRGKKVAVSVLIPGDVLSKITRADAKDIVTYYKLYANAALSIGWIGTTTATGNSLAALFIATGQDVGSIGESSIAHTYVDYNEEKKTLYWEMTFSGIVCGTYGGGTHLPTQREALEMIDCYGAGKVNKFAELAAATALSAEISLISAVCSGEWINAHEKFGRNR